MRLINDVLAGKSPGIVCTGLNNVEKFLHEPIEAPFDLCWARICRTHIPLSLRDDGLILTKRGSNIYKTMGLQTAPKVSWLAAQGSTWRYRLCVYIKHDLFASV
jgi:hypothetical protein